MEVRRTATTLANEAWADAYLAAMYSGQAQPWPDRDVHRYALDAAGQAQRRFVTEQIAFPVPPPSIALAVITLGLYPLARRAWIRVNIRRRERALGISYGQRRRR